jgi:hypothetical protein
MADETWSNILVEEKLMGEVLTYINLSRHSQ